MTSRKTLGTGFRIPGAALLTTLALVHGACSSSSGFVAPDAGGNHDASQADAADARLADAGSSDAVSAFDTLHTAHDGPPEAADAVSAYTFPPIPRARHEVDLPHIPSGCGFPAAAETIEMPPHLFFAGGNATDYFFVGFGINAGIYRMPRTGGAPVQLSNENATSLRLAGDRLVYLIEQAGVPRVIRSMPTAGGAATTLGSVGGGYIYSLVVSTDAIYYLFSERRDSGEYIKQLRRTPLAGGNSEVVLNGIESWFLLADDKHLFWATLTGGVDNRLLIWRHQKGAPLGTVPQLVAATAAPILSHATFTMDETHLYWTSYDSIHRVSKLEPVVETLATARLEIDNMIAVDDEYVYFFDTTNVTSTVGPTPGYLRAVRKTGGPTIDVAQPEQRNNLAVDGDAIQWHDQQGIRRVRRWWRGCQSQEALITWLPGQTHLPAARISMGSEPYNAPIANLLAVDGVFDLQGHGADVVFRQGNNWLRLKNGAAPPGATERPESSWTPYYWNLFSGYRYFRRDNALLRHPEAMFADTEELAAQVVDVQHDAKGITWLEFTAKGFKLTGINASNQRTVYATSNEPAQVAFVQDETYIYWLVRRMTYQILRTSRSGGAPEVLLEDLGPVRAWLEVDDSHVYFVVGEDHPIRRDNKPTASLWALPKGGTARDTFQVTPVAYMGEALVHESGVYWVEHPVSGLGQDGVLRRVEKVWK